MKDDNKTLEYDTGGRDLDGESAPNGGLVDVIFEGTDFDNVQHRQVIATLAPSAVSSLFLNPNLITPISATTMEMMTALLTET